MAVTRFDVLNALATRRERGYTSSTDDDVADELMTSESSEVTNQLEAASRVGLVHLIGRDPDGAPRYSLTRDGERLVTDELND